MKRICRICSVLLASAVMICLAGGCQKTTLQSVWEKTGSALVSGKRAEGKDSGGEWVLLGLKQAGKLSASAAAAYLQNTEARVQSIGSNRLNASKSTDNSRVILGITAAGGDPENFGGQHLLSGLADMEYIKAQGHNGPIWALIAFDSGTYEIPSDPDPEKNVTRGALVREILSSQNGDGGYAMMNGTSDVDLTAMAVTALAPYRANPAVGDAIEDALRFLSGRQEADGGFEGYGARTAESIAQVIIALSALGLDAETEPRFLKGGNDLVKALLTFRTGAGFCHTKDVSEVNDLASEQAYLALTALLNLRNEQAAIYSLNEHKD